MKHMYELWRVVEDPINERPEIRSEDGRLIAVVMRLFPMSEATRSANARLIASAPEMLELLRECRQSAYWAERNMGITPGLRKRINALLKRVEG